MFDITLLDYLHPKDIVWVTNSKLAKIPVFGWIFKLPNLILIDPIKKVL
jgi:1-acyl-sn-glycerol-3-phosphate acyltransferase